jgi:hypothetical protein
MDDAALDQIEGVLSFETVDPRQGHRKPGAYRDLNAFRELRREHSELQDNIGKLWSLVDRAASHLSDRKASPDDFWWKHYYELKGRNETNG